MTDANISEWGCLEIVGRREHWGRLEAADLHGIACIMIRVPQDDGSLEPHYYPHESVPGWHPEPETKVRRIAQKRRYERVGWHNRLVPADEPEGRG